MKNAIKICTYLVSCNVATAIVVFISISIRQTTSEGVPLLLGMWLLLAVLEILTAIMLIPTVDSIYKIVTIGVIQGLLLKYVGGVIFYLAKMTHINIPAIIFIVVLLVVTNLISFVIPYCVIRYLWRLRAPTLS